MPPEFHLRRFVAPPAAAGPAHPPTPSRALLGSLRVEHAGVVALLGNDDLVRPAAEVIAALADPDPGPGRTSDPAHTAPPAGTVPPVRTARVVALAGAAPPPPSPGAGGPGRGPAGHVVPSLAHLPTLPATAGAPGAHPAGAPGAHPTAAPGADPADLASADEVLGVLTVTLRDLDNTHRASLRLAVDPRHRGRGVGGALHALALDVLRAEGRTVAHAVTQSAPVRDAGGDGEPGALLIPATGVGAVRRTPATDWAERRGWRLVQCESHAVATIGPGERAALEALRAEAAAHAGPDHRTHTWWDRTPDRWAPHLARLLTDMSTALPQGDLDTGAEAWDVDRVRAADEARVRAGIAQVTTVVEHAPTGALVAFTSLAVRAGRPGVGYQGDTLVSAPYRGRRLAWLAKAENRLALLAAHPEVARIHTWNAGENAPMIALNERLGFSPCSTEGIWELSPGRG